jgi:hypothetical protein
VSEDISPLEQQMVVADPFWIQSFRASSLSADAVVSICGDVFEYGGMARGPQVPRIWVGITPRSKRWRWVRWWQVAESSLVNPQISDTHVYIVALFGRFHLPRFLDALALEWRGAVDAHTLAIFASRTDGLLVITSKLCLSTSFTSS